MGIRTTRMMARALMQRWPMNERMRQGIVNRLAAVMADKQASAREVVSAAKALIAAESQNQKDEHKDLDEFSNRILQLADRLGIETGDGGVIDAIGGGTTRGDGVPSTAEDQ